MKKNCVVKECSFSVLALSCSFTALCYVSFTYCVVVKVALSFSWLHLVLSLTVISFFWLVLLFCSPCFVGEQDFSWPIAVLGSFDLVFPLSHTLAFALALNLIDRKTAEYFVRGLH